MTDAKPVPTPRKETDASRFLVSWTPPEDALPVVTLEVRPRDQTRVSLGDFAIANPQGGFTVLATPDDYPETVVSRLTRLSSTYDKYELVLHVANYGDRTVTVDVFEAVARAGGVERDDQEDAAAPA